MKTLLVCLILSISLQGQTQVSLSAPAPTNVSNVSVTGGAAGSNTFWYWVVATYPIGKVLPNGPAILIGRDATAGSPVTVSWSGPAGATSYDILKTTTSATPTGTCTCALATAQTGNVVSDTGAALSSYTVTAVSAASATFSLNNQSESAPFVNVSVQSAAGTTNYKLAVIVPGSTSNPLSSASGWAGSTGCIPYRSTTDYQFLCDPTWTRTPNTGNVILTDVTAPIYTATNTSGTQNSAGWETRNTGGRQWFFGAGIPANTNTGWGVAEYTNSVFQGIPIYLKKGGTVCIGLLNAECATATVRFKNGTLVTGATRVNVDLGAADSATTVTVDNAGTSKSQGYQSADGSVGVTGATCSSFKNGLCVAP